MAETLAKLLHRLRHEAKLTQDGLARRSELSIHNVRNYERGSRLPNLVAAYKLAQVLGVSVDLLAECVSKNGRRARRGGGLAAPKQKGRKRKGG
jgi:transcriptional regulator with XRE-family HTH domain